MRPFLQGKIQASVGGVKTELQGLVPGGTLTVSVGQHQRGQQTEFTCPKFTRVGQCGNWCLLPWLLLG